MDSAHIVKRVKTWCKKNDFASIILPGKSPDFSILESMALVYKRRFYLRSSNSLKEGLARFE